MHILTFVNSSDQLRYISCVSIHAPAKIGYSSSERVEDAVKLPYMIAKGLGEMLDYRYALKCNLTSCEAP